MSRFRECGWLEMGIEYKGFCERGKKGGRSEREIDSEGEGDSVVASWVPPEVDLVGHGVGGGCLGQNQYCENQPPPQYPLPYSNHPLRL